MIGLLMCPECREPAHEGACTYRMPRTALGRALGVLLVSALSEEPEAPPTPAPDTCEHGFPRETCQLRFTVPFDPTWRGHEVPGRTIRQVRLAAQKAIERGYTAQALQTRAQWHASTLPAALFRTAVRWGLIP
jgi:hypothetical protein